MFFCLFWIRFLNNNNSRNSLFSQGKRNATDLFESWTWIYLRENNLEICPTWSSFSCVLLRTQMVRQAYCQSRWTICCYPIWIYHKRELWYPYWEALSPRRNFINYFIYNKLFLLKKKSKIFFYWKFYYMIFLILLTRIFPHNTRFPAGLWINLCHYKWFFPKNKINIFILI